MIMLLLTSYNLEEYILVLYCLTTNEGAIEEKKVNNMR